MGTNGWCGMQDDESLRTAREMCYGVDDQVVNSPALVPNLPPNCRVAGERGFDWREFVEKEWREGGGVLVLWCGLLELMERVLVW